ncbi:MAG: hypothetical protein EZS28_039665, partial [Streblomastix strix]
LEIDPLDPDQTIATPEEVPPNAITAAWTLLAGLSGQETSQIDFYAEEPSEEQVVEARQRARAATDLVTRRKPPKHNNPPAQPMLAFYQVLADLETKLLQQNRLIQRTLTQIVKRDQIATLKYNLCTFISMYDTIYKVNMTRAQMITTEQGNLQKTQPSQVIRRGCNNQMFISQKIQSWTEEAHTTSVGTLLTRIVGFTGELDQELKKLTTQQVKDMIRSKPEIMPSEWVQDLALKPILETQLTAFLPLLSQFQLQSLNPYTPLNPFYDQPPQQQIYGEKPEKYLFQHSVQPMQYPIQQSQIQKDPQINKNQIHERSELQNPISLIQSNNNAQTNQNMDYNYIRPQHNTPHMFISQITQLHSQSPSLEETIVMLRSISLGEKLGNKEKEIELRLPKLQQQAGLIDVVINFHQIMEPKIEEKQKKSKVLISRQNKKYSNKYCSALFNPRNNYRPTPISRNIDLNLSEEQWNLFEWNVREGVVPLLSFISGQHRSLGKSPIRIIHRMITKRQ